MKMLGNILIIIIIVLGVVFLVRKTRPAEQSPATDTNTTEVSYRCDASKTIDAVYHHSADTVDVTLSDGRVMNELSHTLSADGARYTTDDESFVFWSRGNGAFITENGTTTFDNCIDISSAPTGTTTGAAPTTRYTNDTYGFSIEYPSDLTPETTFTKYYALGDAWRAQVTANPKGVPVVAIPVYRIDNNKDGIATGKPFPLYYDAEVRVGVSSDATEVKNCLANDPGFTTQKSENVTINGITFKKFSFQDAAMQQYVEGNSYRTVHNNKCYVVEQIRTGSNYRDDSMTAGVTQETLDSYYNQAGNIILGFSFND
jgi:membrane-bound inhibitor of C-type lysozyme